MDGSGDARSAHKEGREGKYDQDPQSSFDTGAPSKARRLETKQGKRKKFRARNETKVATHTLALAFLSLSFVVCFALLGVALLCVGFFLFYVFGYLFLSFLPLR